MSKLLKYYGISLKKGEYLFREGDSADFLYMIYKGEVLINRVISGVEEKIKILEEGEYVGEMAIIDSKPRSANAVALTDCQLVRMTREAFEKNFETNPQLGMSFLQFLSKRIRDTNEIVSFMLTRNRDQFFKLEIAKEAALSGKKDRSGVWRYTSYESFVGKMEEKSSYTKKEITMIITELCASKEITVVRAKDKTLWIGCKLT